MVTNACSMASHDAALITLIGLFHQFKRDAFTGGLPGAVMGAVTQTEIQAVGLSYQM